VRTHTTRYAVRYRMHRWSRWRYRYYDTYDDARRVALAITAEGHTAQIREVLAVAEGGEQW
jgi:hypothetical protein